MWGFYPMFSLSERRTAMQIERFQNHSCHSDPDTLRLMDGNTVLASAWWHSNTQSYRVRLGKEMSWIKSEQAAIDAINSYAQTL